MKHSHGWPGRALGALSLVMTLVAPALAGAAALRTTQVTLPVAPRGERWSTTLAVPQFDAHLGTLRQVTLRLNAHVEGSTRFENLDPRAKSVTQTLSARLDLRTVAATLLQALPLRSLTDAVTGFDGSVDYAGASGRTHPGLSADQVVEVQLTGVPDLKFFTGAGTVPLTLQSRPTCDGVGEGHFAQFFTTRSGGVVTVIYTYEAAPVAVQPVTWSLLKLNLP